MIYIHTLYLTLIVQNLTFTDTGAAAWPSTVTSDDFATVIRQAFEDSHQRNANFNEIASSMGTLFAETDTKMQSLKLGIEGGYSCYNMVYII